MIVRPLVVIHDRLARISAHPIRAHHVAGRHHVRRFMDVGGLQRRGDLAEDAAAVLERPLRIVIDRVGDARPRHADRVTAIEVGHDAIGGERQLLHHRHDRDLTRAVIGQRAIELGAAKTLLDQIASRAVRRARRPFPSGVAQLHPERRMLGPPVARARPLDARRG